MQIEDEKFVVEHVIQGHTIVDIKKMLDEKRNYAVSRRRVEELLASAKERMQDAFVDWARGEIAMEMMRLQTTERVAWERFRGLGANGETAERFVQEIDLAAREGGEEEERRVTREVRETVTKNYSTIELGWFNRILDIQKERRKLLGMYAAKKYHLVEEKRVIHAKGYMGWNPDDSSWPQPALTEGGDGE